MTPEQLNALIQEYFQNNQEELVDYTNKQIEKLTKRLIREAFEEPHRDFYAHKTTKGGSAYQEVNSEVNNFVKDQLKTISLNKEDILAKVNQKIERAVSKLDINLTTK